MKRREFIGTAGAAGSAYMLSGCATGRSVENVQRLEFVEPSMDGYLDALGAAIQALATTGGESTADFASRLVRVDEEAGFGAMRRF